MTFAEIINHILTEHNMSEEDFGFLIGVTESRVGLWLGGFSEPKGSRAAKVKALYSNPLLQGTVNESSQLPFNSIENANHFIKAENTSAIKRYCKQRFKFDFAVLSVLRVMLVIFAVLAFLLTSVFLGIRITAKPMTQIMPYFFGMVLPITLTFFSGNKLVSIAKALTLADKKNFNFFALIFILGILSHFITVFSMDLISSSALILGLSAFLLTLLFVHCDSIIKNTPKNISFKDIISSIGAISAFAFAYIQSDFCTANLAGLDLESQEILDALFPTLCALFVPYLVLCAIIFELSVLVYKTPFCIEKYYRPYKEEKSVSRKSNVLSIISVILIPVIFCGGFYLYSVNTLKKNVEYLLENTSIVSVTEFTNYDEIFTTEKTQTIKTKNFSIKIPAELKINDIDIYTNKDGTLKILTRSVDYEKTPSELFDVFNYDNYEETNHRYIKKYRDVITKYNNGNYPATQLEWQLLHSRVEEFNLNNRYEAAAAIPLISMQSVLEPMYSLEKELYQTDEIEGFIRIKKSSNGNLYFFTFNSTGSDFLVHDITIMISDNNYDSDKLAYQIINSIEFAETK